MAAVLIALYAAFVVFNVLDGYSTWKVLRPDHYARELNPVARWGNAGLHHCRKEQIFFFSVVAFVHKDLEKFENVFKMAGVKELV
ncbi:MAG: hypothetical protein R6T89_05150 [Candidatus Syntrophosphaera sp.]